MVSATLALFAAVGHLKQVKMAVTDKNGSDRKPESAGKKIEIRRKKNNDQWHDWRAW